MADVRSLLRNERASRRLTHPHASYTDSGKLLCTLCALQVKTESLWPDHLQSKQHIARLQQQQQQQVRDTPPQGSKKRKARDEADDTRKRVKGAEDNVFDQAGGPERDDEGDDDYGVEPMPVETVTTTATTLQPAAQVPQAAATVDEDEWAAFERDMAAIEQPAAPVVAASATISAAPMTAEEIAAQAREEQSVQKGRRDLEIEGEKEDAELALQNEFDEMEELEDRVRRLREKREALRKAREVEDEILPDAVSKPAPPDEGPVTSLDQEDDEEEDDEEDFDEWNFGAS